MSPSDGIVLPQVRALRSIFTRIFGDLAAHVHRDHRAATSLTPIVHGGNRLSVPLRPPVAKSIHQAPELEQWADSLPSSHRKLLIIKPHVLVDRVRPRGWQTAEILNQRVSRKVHGRPTVLLQYWGRGRRFPMLMPTLIMQLIASPVFNNSPLLRLGYGPPTAAGAPQGYDLQKLVQRHQGYMLQTFKWLLELLEGEAVVFCAIDAFRALEESASRGERDRQLSALFGLVSQSCEDNGELLDFRLLLMNPRWRRGAPAFTRVERFRTVVALFGLTIVGEEIAESDASSDDSWQTAADGFALL